MMVKQTVKSLEDELNAMGAGWAKEENVNDHLEGKMSDAQPEVSSETVAQPEVASEPASDLLIIGAATEINKGPKYFKAEAGRIYRVSPVGVWLAPDRVNKTDINNGMVVKDNGEYYAISLYQTFIHYHAELKTFKCFKGDCCRNLGAPRARYGVPLIVYDTDLKGQVRSPIVYDIFIWTFSDRLAQSIIDIVRFKDEDSERYRGPVFDMEIRLGIGEVKYQNIEIINVRNKCLWWSSPSIKTDVRRWVSYNTPLKLARSVSLVEFNQVMLGVPAGDDDVVGTLDF